MKFAIIVGLLLLFISFVAAVQGCSSSQEPGVALTGTSAPSSAVSADARVNAILQRSCGSCHWTGGSAPWYAALAPSYLAAGSARKVLNFSDWHGYDEHKQAAELKSIAATVSSGSMPPGDFTAFNHSARLSDEDRQALLAWVSKATTR